MGLNKRTITGLARQSTITYAIVRGACNTIGEAFHGMKTDLGLFIQLLPHPGFCIINRLDGTCLDGPWRGGNRSCLATIGTIIVVTVLVILVMPALLGSSGDPVALVLISRTQFQVNRTPPVLGLPLWASIRNHPELIRQQRVVCFLRTSRKILFLELFRS